MTLWDESSVDVLMFWWAHGKTGNEIAKELGRTRGSVHGKIHRLGLKRETSFERKTVCHKFKPTGKRNSLRPNRALHVWLHNDEMECFEKIAKAVGATKVGLARQAVLFALANVADTETEGTNAFNAGDRI